MSCKALIKSIPLAELGDTAKLISYKDGESSCLTLSDNEALTISLHAVSRSVSIGPIMVDVEAMVQILEGSVSITINHQKKTVAAGQVLIFPTGSTGSFYAETNYKMLLTEIKNSEIIEIDKEKTE